jgi:hypothetical protein
VTAAPFSWSTGTGGNTPSGLSSDSKNAFAWTDVNAPEINAV